MSGEGGVQNPTDSCLKLEKIVQIKMCFCKQDGCLPNHRQSMSKINRFFLKFLFSISATNITVSDFLAYRDATALLSYNNKI